MHAALVIVDNPQDWKAFYPSDRVISVQDYLSSDAQYKTPKAQVINLCRSYKYLSNGYYCSLLAEARNHKVIPSVRNINDLSNKSLYSLDIDNLHHILDKLLQDELIESDRKTVKLFFGAPDITQLESLGRQLFELFPCPILHVRLKRHDHWFIESIRPGSMNKLNDHEQDLFVAALERFNDTVWRKPRLRKTHRYDLAILVNPKEKMPPSNPAALKKFVRLGKQMGINIELITHKDYISLAEYDALFIRETTAINNHTYRFAKRAESEGMVVIDDPQSILRCTNKVYLADLLSTNGIATPKTLILSKDRKKEDIQNAIETMGYPMVIKIPDGSFSRGIVKVENEQELKQSLDQLFKQSSLVLAQAYTFTDYDWRVGILNRKPIYVCQYFMSRGHWQIYKHSDSGRVVSGGFSTLPVHETPKKVIDIATRAANLIGDGLYGVDVKQSGDKVMIIEVNDNPSIDSGVEDLYSRDELYRTILKEFIFRLERKHIGS